MLLGVSLSGWLWCHETQRISELTQEKWSVFHEQWIKCSACPRSSILCFSWLPKSNNHLWNKCMVLKWVLTFTELCSAAPVRKPGPGSTHWPNHWNSTIPFLETGYVLISYTYSLSVTYSPTTIMTAYDSTCHHTGPIHSPLAHQRCPDKAAACAPGPWSSRDADTIDFLISPLVILTRA